MTILLRFAIHLVGEEGLCSNTLDISSIRDGNPWFQLLFPGLWVKPEDAPPQEEVSWAWVPCLCIDHPTSAGCRCLGFGHLA